MKDFKLSPNEINQLKLLHKKQHDRRMAYKINAIILLGSGWTLVEVSEALLLDSETLRHYVKKYREGKLEELLKLHYKGRVSRLSREEKLELKDHLLEYTYPDVQSILAYVKKKYGVVYQSTAMRTILRELGFVYKKPKLVPGRSDPVAVMNHLARYRTIRESGSPVYFMDGVHPQHNSRPHLMAGYSRAKQRHY